jgi:hypothetical protein
MSSWTDEDYIAEAHQIISRESCLEESVAESLAYYRDMPSSLQPDPKKLVRSVKQLDRQMRGVSL